MDEPRHPQDGSVVDVVDRGPKRNLHGVTWQVRADAMLDEISRLQRERDQLRAELDAVTNPRPPRIPTVIHVTPDNGHHTEPDCACEPTLEAVTRDDGSIRFTYLHHSRP